jgi:hypothetical protein
MGTMTRRADANLERDASLSTAVSASTCCSTRFAVCPTTTPVSDPAQPTILLVPNPTSNCSGLPCDAVLSSSMLVLERTSCTKKFK